MNANHLPWNKNGIFDVEKWLSNQLMVVQTCGFSWVSGKNWNVIHHPKLGQISWKMGTDFRDCQNYLHLRVNGVDIDLNKFDGRWYN